MTSPLRSAADLVAASQPSGRSLEQLARIDLSRALDAGVERVLAGDGFTAAELSDEGFLFELARRLLELRYFNSVAAAQEFVQILSADALGRQLTPGMREWLQAHRAHLVRTRELRERGARELEMQQGLRAAEEEVDRIAAALSFEKDRLAAFSVVETKGRENYFAQIVGKRNIHGSAAVSFMGQWLAERELARFTSEFVIPEIERRLAAAQSQVATFRADGASAQK